MGVKVPFSHPVVGESGISSGICTVGVYTTLCGPRWRPAHVWSILRIRCVRFSAAMIRFPVGRDLWLLDLCNAAAPDGRDPLQVAALPALRGWLARRALAHVVDRTHMGTITDQVFRLEGGRLGLVDRPIRSWDPASQDLGSLSSLEVLGSRGVIGTPRCS